MAKVVDDLVKVVNLYLEQHVQPIVLEILTFKMRMWHLYGIVVDVTLDSKEEEEPE